MNTTVIPEIDTSAEGEETISASTLNLIKVYGGGPTAVRAVGI